MSPKSPNMKTKTESEQVRKWAGEKPIWRQPPSHFLTFSLSHLRSLFLAALLLASLSPCAAADYYTTLTITVTNTAGIATNGTDTLTVIGDTRTATNIVAGNPSKLWLGTNVHLRAATNLYTHLALYPFGSGATRLGAPRWGATNIIRLDSQINQSISASAGGVWGTVLVTTNYTTNTIPVTVPASTWTDVQKTNIGNGLVAFLDRASSSIATTAQGLSNYVALYTQQTLSNKVFYASTNRGGAFEQVQKMSGTNATWTNVVLVVVDLSRVQSLSGLLTALTNGYLTSNFIHNAILSNAVLHATSGYITNVTIENITTNKMAKLLITSSINIGGTNVPPSFISGITAVGSTPSFRATGFSDTASSNPSFYSERSGGSEGTPTNVLAGYIVGDLQFLGQGTTQQKIVTVLEATAVADFSNSSADTLLKLKIGRTNSSTPEAIVTWRWGVETNNANVYNLSNVVTSGNTDIGGKVQLGTATNNTWTGTNVLNGRLDLTPRANTALANGYNSGTVLGTNVYIRCSGPTAAYTNAGFAAAVDGTWHKVQFDNPGLSYTLLPESGLEATAANRILTGTGALLNSTNNPAVAELMYDGAASRWRIWSFR